MANYHHVFYKVGDSSTYKYQLEPEDNKIDELKKAKQKIRQRLLNGLRHETEVFFGPGKGVSPRFFTQGSWAYGTCNAPCHAGQEIDIDLGVYLPIEEWEETQKTPKQAAKIFFEMVERILKPLAEEENWDFSTKKTCVRLHLPDGLDAHIDVPLYVAPKKDFITIREAMDSRGIAIAKASDEELTEQQWKDIEQVVLATREGEWWVSDPRDVANYFENLFSSEGGQQLRRICRYLKAMRDHKWKTGGGPSSVLLMLCASKLWKFEDQRDDIALRTVLRGIGSMLSEDVYEASICDENFNRMDEEDRRASKKWSDSLFYTLYKAIETDDKGLIGQHLKEMQYIFDHRIPENEDLVALTVSANEIRSTPSRQQPQPHINHVEAG